MEQNLKSYIEELISEIQNELDEATVTGDIAGYNVPGAFSNGGSNDKKRKKKISTMFGMKLVGKIDEGMFSTLDQIKKDSVDLKSFIKNIFSDKQFKDVKSDKDFHKYLKSFYNESIVTESKDEVNPKQLANLQKDIAKINRKIKVYISKHPVTKGKLQIELGSDHPSNQGDDREITKINALLKKHTGDWRTGTMFTEGINEGPMDRIFGGIPYTKKGKESMVTMKLPDDVKKRIIQRAEKEGKVAKPNFGGGVTVFESVIDEVIDKDDLKTAKELLKYPHTIEDIEYRKTSRGDKFVKIIYKKKYVPGKMMDTGPHFVSVFYTDEKDLQNIGKALKLKLKESLDEACWKGYKQVGGKVKNGKQVPNCVPTNKSISESMMSTLDQMKRDSKNIRDFIKKVLSDKDFRDMKGDKDFIKYLGSMYEGVTEGGIPQNWMQGRTSDYHTKLRGKDREYDDTNFDKENSGQEDLEESTDSLEYLKLLNKAFSTMPGSPKQKAIIKKLNVIRKSSGEKPLKEYGQRLDLSYLEDEEARLDGTPKPKDTIDTDLDEQTLNELGVFPIRVFLQDMIPSSIMKTTTPKDKERLKATIKDLIFTLNRFWKQHNIPYRVREK